MLLWVLLLGCRDATVEPCQTDFDPDGAGGRTRMVTLQDDDLEGPLVMEIDVPWESTRYDDGAPTVVFIHGSWENDAVPLQEARGRLDAGHGISTIYINLPGGGLDSSSGGTNDRRGPWARRAVAAALRYAAGWTQDNAGCTMDERVPGGRAEQVGLAAFSNGGNLAWQTAGDATLDLPQIVGIATFETPANGQFVLAEPGTEERESPLYQAGSCALDDANALVCDYPYPDLAYDPSAESGGIVYIDENTDTHYDDDDDFPLGEVLDPLLAAWVISSPARAAATADGIQLPNRADLDQAQAFWAEREAPRAMASAAARFPELAGIEVGTEQDHVLVGATDHPHVTGMVAAMQAAGVSWTRLHPDAAYAAEISGADWTFADQPANTPVSVGQDLPMEPEDGDEVRGTNYLTAAIAELLDRSHEGDWSDDLDAPLW